MTRRKGKANKLAHDRWLGPFRVVERVTPVTFRLRNVKNRLLKQLAHASRLKPYYEFESRPLGAPDLDPGDETRRTTSCRKDGTRSTT
ncbi:MAG: hypothetical protein ACK4UX_13240 [Thiobacillus sp.]